MYWHALHCIGLHTCIILNQPELLMDYMNLNYVLLHGIVFLDTALRGLLYIANEVFTLDCFTRLLAALNCTDPQRTPLDCFTLHCIASACIIDGLGLIRRHWIAIAYCTIALHWWNQNELDLYYIWGWIIILCQHALHWLHCIYYRLHFTITLYCIGLN